MRSYATNISGLRLVVTIGFVVPKCLLLRPPRRYQRPIIRMSHIEAYLVHDLGKSFIFCLLFKRDICHSMRCDLALSLAETCGKFLTAACAYCWTFRLVSPKYRLFLSWINSWLTLAGLWTVSVSVTFTLHHCYRAPLTSTCFTGSYSAYRRRSRGILSDLGGDKLGNV